ncbi:MAG: transcription elongation factor GreA [Chloroflexi bacterium]|nr:transcription elongation factor GreA [Chloroflexota bacterium]
MSQKSIPLTPEGLRQLEQELETLRTVRRPQVAEELKRAKEVGGTVNNAEYEAAKDEQGFVEGRIRHLENIIRNATVIARDTAPSQWVKLGSQVTLVDQEGQPQQYTIVGSAEADPRHGRISNESPVGRALLGCRIGQQVEVLAPGGVISYTVVAIA